MKELKFMTWKPVIGYEGSYEISNTGQVRGIDRVIFKRGFPYNIKGKLLKQTLNKKGYPRVKFTINNNQLERNPHRLVAEAFITNPNNFPQVNHINGIKTDNNIENLEWVNNSMNILHAYSLGLQPSRKGENNSNAKLNNNSVTLIKQKYNNGANISSISKEMNINLSIIRQLIYGRTWKSHDMIILKRDERIKLNII